MISYQELNERYLHYLEDKSSHPFYCRLYRQCFLQWREHPTKKLLRDWNKEHATTPAHANKGIGYHKAMYNWAINEELWHTENPALGIKRHRQFGRKRTLTLAELTVLFMSFDALWLKLRVLLIILITTGCRLSEALKMQWSQINLDSGMWHKINTKNGSDQLVPLPRQTCRAIGSMPRRSQYVLPGMYDRHLSRAQAEKLWGYLRRPLYQPGDKAPALRMPDVRLHDFRRTVGTMLGEQGANAYLIKAVLNHCRESSDPTAVYERPSFDRQAIALQRHADLLWSLTKEGIYVDRPARAVVPNGHLGAIEAGSSAAAPTV